MTHGSLFSGIGGFDLAAQNVGLTNIFQVEKDSYCLKVLNKNFPKVIKYTDIKDFRGDLYNGAVDVISGGFPCQPFSIAGKRQGKDDDRFLWGEMLRVISEIKPKWVIAENVYGILSIEQGMVFEQVHTDLENIGYKTQTFIVPACAKNAPHKRERVWIIANSTNSVYRSESITYPNSSSTENKIQTGWHKFGSFHLQTISSNSNIKRLENRVYKRKSYTKFKRSDSPGLWEEFPTQSPVCRRNDGVSNQLDRNKRIAALGNAIVPQIAEMIFKCILLTENIGDL